MKSGTKTRQNGIRINGLDIEGAIFDLDGTLADSLDVWDRIDAEFFENNGLEMPPDYQLAIKSMGFARAAKYTLDRFGLLKSASDIMAQWRDMARNKYAFEIPLKDGAAAYLCALHENGVKLGLATASGRELFEPLLKRHGVKDLFCAFVTTAQAGSDKDRPDVFLMCAEELGCDPGKCMVFEDILPAILSAKSAGMMAAGVYDSHSAHERDRIVAASDYYIKDYKKALSELRQKKPRI